MISRWIPSPTLARYTGKMFLWRSLAFLAGLVLILQTLDLLGESGEILKAPGNGEADLWRYVSLRMPQLIALFLPFSVLLGALLTFLTLNQNSEVVILKSAGLSPHQILLPMIVVGLAVAAVSFVFNERVLVRAQAEFDVWKENDYRNTPDGTPKSTQYWVRAGDDLILAGRVEGQGASTVLRDVTVFDRVNDRLRQVVRAEDAKPAGPSAWRLRDARVFDVAAGRQTRYVTLDLPLTATPAQFTVQSVNADHTAFWNLQPAIEALRAAGKPTDQLTAKLYHKITGPLAAALMPLLGAVAAFGLARSGKLFLRAVAGLALGFAFFVADNFAMAMGDFGSLPPLAAACAPFLLFLIVGEAVLMRSEE